MLDDFIKDLIRSNALNYKEGSLEILHIPGLVLPTPTYANFLEQVYEKNGLDELLEMMYNMGYNHGKTAVEDVGRRSGTSKKEFARKVIRTGNVMGLGVIEVENCDFENKALTVSIANSPITKIFQDSETLPDPDRPIHEFWRGAFHAISEDLFNTDMICKETKCEYLGADKCLVKCEPVQEE